MNGVVNDADLKSFLSLIHLDRLSGVVRVYNEDGTGRIYFDQGHPCNAEYNGLVGSQAILAILQADKANLEILPPPGDMPQRMNEYPLEYLLMESARIYDERVAGRSTDSIFHAIVSDADRELLDSQAIPRDEVSLPPQDTKMLNNQKIQEVLAYLSSELGDGLIAADVYSPEDGQSYGGFNSNARACALFARMTSNMQKSLAVAGFPALEGYYMINLQGNVSAFVLPGLGFEVGMLVNTTKTKVGLVANLVIPQLLQILNA